MVYLQLFNQISR